MTPVQSAQEYVDSGCDSISKAHIVALIAECERLGAVLKRLIASDDAHQTIHAPDGDDIARMIEFSEAWDEARAALAARKEQS